MDKDGKHKSASILLTLDGDKVEGEIEGSASDLVHLVAHCIEANEKFEAIVLDAIQRLASQRILDALAQQAKDKELLEGKEVKN